MQLGTNNHLLMGSVLGPLLFTIFINFKANILSHSCKLFINYSKLVVVIKNNIGSYQLQEDINNLLNWADEWRMLLNPS